MECGYYVRCGRCEGEAKATVARFPNLNEDRNENVDVKDIPCGIIAK